MNEIRITPRALAGIVVDLLTQPGVVGELEEQTAYLGFVEDVGRAVADSCGGQVRECEFTAQQGYVLSVVVDDSVPSETANVWTTADLRSEAAAPATPDALYQAISALLAAERSADVYSAIQELRTAAEQTYGDAVLRGVSTRTAGPSM